MNITARLLIAGVLTTAANADTFEYAAEDGGNTNSYLNSFDANATWGNTFVAEPGYETITTVRVELGSLFTDDTRPVNILIFEDPNDLAPEFDPANAVLISHTTATAILTPDGQIADYPIEPVTVEGRFFVAINMDVFIKERVFRQDFWQPGTSSWTFYSPVGTPQLDLGANKYTANNAGFGTGTWVVRALGTAQSGGCNPADLAEPFSVLDLGDVQTFVSAFTGGDLIADLTGDTVLDLADLQAFVTAFIAGCP